jgi:hypothetical protein
MVRDGIRLDHPDDLMINDTPDAARRITILDTNNLISFANTVNWRNAKVFLEECGIAPASIRTPEDIIHMMHDTVPSLLDLDAQQAEELRTQDYPTLMSRLRDERGERGDLARQLREALLRVPRNPESVPPELRDNPYLNQLLYSGLSGLISLVDRFAPEGQHPHLLAKIMDTFGISDADLQQAVSAPRQS